QEFPQIQAQVEGIVGSMPTPAPLQYAPDHPEAAMAAHVPGFLQEEGFLAALRHDGHVRTLEEIEHEMILFAIARYGSQMSEVARRLGIGRSTLYRKLKELGIDHVEGKG